MIFKRIPKVAVVSAVLAGLSVAFAVNPQDDDSKAIKAEVFIKARPAKTARTNAKYRNVSKPTEAGVTTPPPGTTLAQMGVTIWRFRPTRGTDTTKELVEEEEGKPTEWTLERIEEGTLLSPGQRVRLSLESLSREGYLYVIDREEYADGTLGDPVLIFPTQKNADASRVRPGRLTYIPSDTGRFRIKPSDSSKTHVAEILTIIVSPTPLFTEDQLGPKSIKLAREQVEAWQRLWGAAATKFEMDGGMGQAMTRTEQSAGAQLLTQEDPVPQTVYQVAARPNNPVLITVPLRFTRAE